jgi:hypothetical protein
MVLCSSANIESRRAENSKPNTRSELRQESSAHRRSALRDDQAQFEKELRSLGDVVQQMARDDQWLRLLLWLKTTPTCSTRYPVDFGANGDIKGNRVPMGPPSIIMVNGFHCLPVWKGYVIACGENIASMMQILSHENHIMFNIFNRMSRKSTALCGQSRV